MFLYFRLVKDNKSKHVTKEKAVIICVWEHKGLRDSKVHNHNVYTICAPNVL